MAFTASGSEISESQTARAPTSSLTWKSALTRCSRMVKSKALRMSSFTAPLRIDQEIQLPPSTFSNCAVM